MTGIQVCLGPRGWGEGPSWRLVRCAPPGWDAARQQPCCSPVPSPVVGLILSEGAGRASGASDGSRVTEQYE